MQKGKVFIILFGLAVNTEFKYPKFFAMIPSGPDPKPSFTLGFFETAAAQNPKPTDRRAGRGRRRVRQQRLRGRAHQRGEVRLQGRL